MGACISKAQEVAGDGKGGRGAGKAPPAAEPTGAPANGGGGGMTKVPSHQTFFRKSQEEGMAHLVRHPRLYPFASVGGRRVGGGGAARAGLAAQRGGHTPLPVRRRRFGLDSLYSMVRLLGRGGTGQTWLAREGRTGAEFAIKLMQRPIPRSTVGLTFNERTVGGWWGGGAC